MGRRPSEAIPTDLRAALEQLPAACVRLRKNLLPRSHRALSQLELTIRSNLNPAEAYNMVPWRDPQNG